jgi:hypothetical protein
METTEAVMYVRKTHIMASRYMSFVCVCKEICRINAAGVAASRRRRAAYCSARSNGVSPISRFFSIEIFYNISIRHSGLPVRLPVSENNMIKKTISVYWPLAIVLPLAVAGYLHFCNGAKRAAQAPLAADEFTAELARAVSYGMVDGAPSAPARPLHAMPAMPVPVAEPS